MYYLYDNVSEKDFIWIKCDNPYEKRKVVQEFILKGYTSYLNDIDYDGLAHLIIDLKNKIILHCGPSMAYNLKKNGVKYKNGYAFIKRIIN